MSGTGFAIAAYVCSAVWYGGYLFALRRRERELDQRGRRG